MIAFAAGIALVAARLFIGRGGALAAAAFFLVIRGVVALIVGPILGEHTPTFPLYLGSAIVVELLALAVPLLRRPVVFGAIAGVLIGTVGFATEFGWSHVRSTLSWGSDILVEGTLMAIVGGVAGAVLGGLLASGLRRRLPAKALARTLVVGCVVLLAAAVTNGLIIDVPKNLSATFSISDAQSSPRMGNISVKLDPATTLDNPSWVTITSWQGGGLVVDALKQTGPGTYQSTQPIPLYGKWKTLLRIHDGRILTGVPIYLPADAAIPAPAIKADDGTTRKAIPEIKILQRERKDGSMVLWTIANVVVLVCTLALIAAMSWGVARYSRRAGARDPYAGASPPDPDAASARTPSELGSR
jgi:hypothetical protein